MGAFDRTAQLLGTFAVEKLASSSVAVFGLGGVGSYAAEALVRAGVGRLLLVDADVVDETNLNRQLVALRSTVGHPKAEVMRERVADINPGCRVEARVEFYPFPIDFSSVDYVADCIDTVSSKLALIEACRSAGTPVISCMGTGNKLDAGAVEVAAVEDTSVCPLARVMRCELKKRGISGVKCVYSRELPRRTDGGRVPASVSYVPGSAGLLLAGEIIRDLIGLDV